MSGDRGRVRALRSLRHAKVVELSISGDLVQRDHENFGVGSVLVYLTALEGNAKLLHINDRRPRLMQVV